MAVGNETAPTFPATPESPPLAGVPLAGNQSASSIRAVFVPNTKTAGSYGTRPRGSRTGRCSAESVTSPPDDDATAAFPELRRLEQLRDAGWSFTPARDDEGELLQLNGLRTWPGGQADALRVRFTDDAAAIRFDEDGNALWTCEGTLAEVVDGLLALPPP